MNKLLLSLLCLSLAGCFTTGRRGADAVPATYDLGPVQARSTADKDKVWPAVAVEVRVPSWFDSLGIEYRLNYADAERLHDYALARWAASPASLIQQRLVQQLGASPVGQGGARCVLRIEIDEFSHTFDTPESSRGVLRGRATLLDSGRRTVAERDLAYDTPALSGDSRGGVVALGTAVDRMAADLAAWRPVLAAKGVLQPCMPR